ncbi:MAG: ABC transporter ATP-binding protein, partial [Gaiellales bacterium]
RQRLGIARCLLADPQLLILDEPMNGLDPAGIMEFRAFVRAFVADGCTIVLSSHLLDEIEKTCDHIAIVDRGQIIVQGTVGELRGENGAELTVRVDDAPRARALLGTHRAVAAVALGGADGELRVSLLDPHSVAELNRTLVEAGIAVRQLAQSQATLEQRFLEVTSRLDRAT